MSEIKERPVRFPAGWTNAQVARLLGWEFRERNNEGAVDTWVGFRDGKECAWYHNGPPKFDAEWSACGELIDWMKERGSSFELNFGEDTGCWECSWIAGGARSTGISKVAQKAVCIAALQGAA